MAIFLASPIDVTEKLFFAIFGQKDADDFMTSLQRKLQPVWTIYLFKVSFSLYMLVSVIILINLLIAMMSDTYQRIVSQSDIEWKYGLSKLIRSVQRARSTPTPLNLFTTWISWLRKMCNLRNKSKENTKVIQGFLGHRGGLLQQNQHLDNGKRHGVNGLQPSSAGSAFTFATVPGINTVVDWAIVRKKYRMRFGDEIEKPL